MNGSGLFLVGILIVVLIGIAIGSTQVQADLNDKVAQLTSERNTTLQLALEAKSQRDAAVAQLSGLKDELSRATSRIATLQDESSKIEQELSSAQSTISTQGQQLSAAQNTIDQQSKELSGAQTTINQKNQELTNARTMLDQQGQEIERLNKNMAELRQTLSQQHVAQPVPVTSAAEPRTQAPANSDKMICLPVAADEFPRQVGLGLVMLAGILALGSGGYIVYHHDPDRRYTVKMTKGQLRAFARFQREQGS